MFNLERALQATAIVLMFVAAYFVWRAIYSGRSEIFDYALTAAALGLCAWFMRYRFEIKHTLEADERPAEEDAETDTGEELTAVELADTASPPHSINALKESQINYVEQK